MSKTKQSKRPDEIRAAFFALGFLRPSLRIRLRAAGIRLVPFGFGRFDHVIVWGRKPASNRGIFIAKILSKKLLSVEDAWVRALGSGGWPEPPLGLLLDPFGIHYAPIPKNIFDAPFPPLTNAQKIRAHRLRTWQIEKGISKYNSILKTTPALPQKEDYILVIDQIQGDSSITHSGADAARFNEMLRAAKNDYPNSDILIRTHPRGRGHFDHTHYDERTKIIQDTQNPIMLLSGAKAVYTVSSQMGLEAIFCGHKPHVFAQPFYAGRGLSHDAYPLNRPQWDVDTLYSRTMIDIPVWFNRAGAHVSPEIALGELWARWQHHTRFDAGVRLENIRAWKRPHMRHYFKKRTPKGMRIRWGEALEGAAVLEDGFLRSRGLGAKLVPPLSLIVDQSGIYFDPTRESDLEKLIHSHNPLSEFETYRAQQLREKIVTLGLGKYNLKDGETPNIPKGREIILVPGQVQDDRSILLGATGEIKDIEGLLRTVRAKNPDSFIIYKPHPDVTSGLRAGMMRSPIADLVYTDGNLEALWPVVDHVATLTSLAGFEALLRGKKVTTYGMPFYADWGLTCDHAPTTHRRGQVSLDTLVYAALIAYPIYYDPKSRTISSAEVILERLADPELQFHPYGLRLLTRLQQKIRSKHFI